MNTVNKQKIAVAVSGGGRSLENLLERQKESPYFEICGVISSKKDCRANQIARDHGLKLHIETFKAKHDPSDELLNFLEEVDADWVALAGFLNIFPTDFSDSCKWKHKIVNIHPALLPNFGGKGMYGHRVHKAVLEAQENFSGATIHYVTGDYDKGKIISQIKVQVKENDSVDSLAKRVFDAECELYPKTLEDLISGKLPEEGIKIYEYCH